MIEYQAIQNYRVLRASPPHIKGVDVELVRDAVCFFGLLDVLVEQFLACEVVFDDEGELMGMLVAHESFGGGEL